MNKSGIVFTNMEIVIGVTPEFRWTIPEREEVQIGIGEQSAIVLATSAKVALYAVRFIGALPESVKRTVSQVRQMVRSVFWNGRTFILDPFLLVFKTAEITLYLALAVIFNAHAKAYDLIDYNEAASSGEHPATKYIGRNIDLTHVKAIKKDLDISHLGSDIRLENLYTFFDASNFNPAQLNDDGTACTKASLRDGLKTFIDNINNRTPFLGTPLAFKVDELNAFYDHLKKAVLICIDKVKDDREQQEVLSLAFAVAGKHCGARYKSEALAALARLNPVDLSVMAGSVQEMLWTILADKRLDIATRLSAQAQLGTHGTPQYSRDFGEMLGLEGMQNVTEQINSAKLNPDVHVKKFFSEYTEDVIIQTVQSALRDVKAGEFRQQVMDWLIDQIDEWANEEPAIQDLVHDCKEVRDSGETEEVKLTQLRTIYLLKGTDKLYATNAQIPLDLLSPDDALLERTARTIYQTRIRSVFTNKVAFRAAFEAIGINAGRLKDYDLPPAIIRLLLVKNQILTCKDYVDRDVLAHLGGDSIASNLSFYPQDVVYLPEGMRSSQDLAIKNIFEESFKLDPNRVLGAYKKDIPLWKASIINGAKVLTAVFTSMIFKVVLVWQTFWFTWPLMRFAYDLIRASMLAIPHAAPILNFMFFLSYFLWWAGRTRIFFFEACTTLGSICGKIWQASQNLGNYMKDFQEKMTRNHIEQAKSEIFPKWKEALPLIAAGLL